MLSQTEIIIYDSLFFTIDDNDDDDDDGECFEQIPSLAISYVFMILTDRDDNDEE